MPESVKRRGFQRKVEAEFDSLAALYDAMVQAGVPAEDARFILPNATQTNFKVTVNFLELLHIADLRLCTRAQWEFRKVVAMMRAEVMRKFPSWPCTYSPSAASTAWVTAMNPTKLGRLPHRQEAPPQA